METNDRRAALLKVVSRMDVVLLSCDTSKFIRMEEISVVVLSVVSRAPLEKTAAFERGTLIESANTAW